MVLTTKDAHTQTLYVHNILKHFMAGRGYKTTTFVHPHEYNEAPNGCIGLYSWTDDKSIIFGVMEDGTIKELTVELPQDSIAVLEKNFRRVICKKPEANGTTTP